MLSCPCLLFSLRFSSYLLVWNTNFWTTWCSPATFQKQQIQKSLNKKNADPRQTGAKFFDYCLLADYHSRFASDLNTTEKLLQIRKVFFFSHPNRQKRKEIFSLFQRNTFFSVYPGVLGIEVSTSRAGIFQLAKKARLGNELARVKFCWSIHSAGET